MKTEHEKLKWICDKLGYKLYEKEYIKDGADVYTNIISSILVEADVRETIFTQEFMEKLAGYLFIKLNENMLERDQQIDNILLHLNNPTEYLYNLIK